MNVKQAVIQCGVGINRKILIHVIPGQMGCSNSGPAAPAGAGCGS